MKFSARGEGGGGFPRERSPKEVRRTLAGTCSDLSVVFRAGGLIMPAPAGRTRLPGAQQRPPHLSRRRGATR